jgi:hypothetical protein
MNKFTEEKLELAFIELHEKDTDILLWLRKINNEK